MEQHQEQTGKKLRIGWFTFTCCEDSTVIFTEIMNDHFETWRKVLDIRHARVLQTKNVLDELDVAFVEGAINSAEQEAKLKEIREKSTKLVAIGACACTGMPSAQRNAFPAELKDKIKFLLDRFNQGEKVKKLDEVVTVDERVPGCPMTEAAFLTVVTKMLVEFGIVPKESGIKNKE
jgi:coenzyme F420-reducing hydrogenase gamma subunit